ncbi:HK97 gp10 family phage protein [Candidatus Bathyarchaeota archaeon A05DMB-2]|jgi:HK97 gp10 family phage protein|nr:HK97 gp10 family phage protein [Candidatus Bathyarchaeota archaeon A05DMB-2]
MSVDIGIDVAGAEEFQQAIAHFDADMQRRVQEQLARWAEAVTAEARRLVPVRTGYLRSTIYTRTVGWSAEVGAEASYASSVEFGTCYAAAKPFLNPAVQARLPELERFLLEALDLAKSEAGV